MDQDAQISDVIRSPWLLRISAASWTWSIVGGLTVLAYAPVLSKLVNAWWRVPDYSHGFLVPVFAAYLIWAKKDLLRATELHPTWLGVAVIAFALGLLILGEFGAEFFVARLSFVIMLAGLILTFGGWELLKKLRFVLLVLLLAVPVPTIVFNEIALPLQLLASKSASVLLHLFSVPAVRLGNVIELPQIELEVAEACSGIRSLVSLFTFAVFYGYFLEKTFSRRLILALVSIPIAIAANVVRIFGTGVCVQYWDADKAMGFFHEFSGWVMFLVSLACLSIVHYVLLLFPGRKRAI
jgi:exosortase